ncbi:hypothetical protein [Clostridium beijerinckii]|uniref:Uncharacterized protein n=1 Tax=Clostridium beijerinckii TaxID=1520 RepID=A0A1S8S4N5_CLOBE|nr:hypothetical protein [Clostridium beijerinckii]NRY59519.1 hypothetical protein [Clostridium beijerinckii]OOM60275.1 hypothetical protein CLBCK_29740 [Clostridium beijerinckii]
MGNAIENTVTQGLGNYVNYVNNLRYEELQRVLQEISNKLDIKLSIEDANLIKALGYVENVRGFISNPNKILGSQLTKHGEIAEQIDVNIGNARDVLNGLKDGRLTFDGVGRTAPEDFLDGAMKVQSKFYNGINNTLKAVLEHNGKYEYFGSDGRSYYSIPKDYYETIQKILNGDNVDDLNLKTTEKIKQFVSEIEQNTGRPFNDVVKPSISNYNDVQMGNADNTLKNEESALRDQSNKNKNEAKKEAEDSNKNAINNSGPSLKEAAKITGVAALVSGGMSFAISVYKKKKRGINLSQFTVDDWKDVGIDTGKGAARGGISGLSIYALTNFAKTPAPLASGYVSATFGMINLANQYRNGQINTAEFIENGQIVCIDSAVSVIGAAMGTTIIPVPVLGAVIGSIAANAMMTISKQYLENNEQILIKEYNNMFMKELDRLNSEHLRILGEIMQQYYLLGEITGMAFDFKLNSKLRFDKSIELAKLYRIDDNEILKTSDDIASYFLD